MEQTDLVAGVGLVSRSSFFISPKCIAWLRSGSTYFPGHYTLFIENLMFWLYGAWEKKKNLSSFLGWAIPWLKVNMVTEPAHFHETSQPSKQVKIFYIIRNCEIRSIYLWNKLILLLRQASSWWVNMPHLISSKDSF